MNLHPPTLTGPSRPSAIAFTLVELLTVVAIIGILAGLGVGAVSGTVRRAKDARCKNNLKQLSTALISYVGSHGQYPQTINPEVLEGKTNNWIWCHVLEREMTSDERFLPPRFLNSFKDSVWECPAMRTAAQRQDLGYGYNTSGVSSDRTQEPLGLGGKVRGEMMMGMPEPNRFSVKDGEVVNPARMLALGDGVAGWADTYRVSMDFIRMKPIGVSQHAFDVSRHRRRVNAAFADGHVETIPLQTLFSDPSDEALSVWNRDHQPHRERLDQ